MRVTASDPNSLGVLVWLDGVEQHNVKWADDDLGMLCRVKVGLDGIPLFDAAGMFITETVRGHVRIRRLHFGVTFPVHA